MFFSVGGRGGHRPLEKELIRDLIFVFQGIDGTMIRWDESSGSFNIVSKVRSKDRQTEQFHKVVFYFIYFTEPNSSRNETTNPSTSRVGLFL